MGDILSKCPGGSCEAVGAPPPVERGMTFVHGTERAPATAEAKTIEHSPTPPRQRHSSAPPARELKSETQEHDAPSATPPRCMDGDCNPSPTQEPGKAARGVQHQENCVVLSPPMQLWPPAALAQRERALAAEQALQALRRQRAAESSVHRAMRRRPIPCSAPADRPRDIPKEDPHPDPVPGCLRAGAKVTFSDHTDDYNKQVRGPAQRGCPAPKVLKNVNGEQHYDGNGQLGLRMRWGSRDSRGALRERSPNGRAGHSS